MANLKLREYPAIPKPSQHNSKPVIYCNTTDSSYLRLTECMVPNSRGTAVRSQKQQAKLAKQIANPNSTTAWLAMDELMSPNDYRT